MSEVKETVQFNQLNDALSSRDTLALLIPRLRMAVAGVKEKRRQKQLEELLCALDELDRLQSFVDHSSQSSKQQSDLPFYEGLPRCTFQVESQFRHYVNPEASWRETWAKQRSQVWGVFEKTIPWSVREVLVSWRWNAELDAFRRISEALKKSIAKVTFVEQKILSEERRASSRLVDVSGLDRLKILFWSRRTKKDEQSLLKLEQERDEVLRQISEKLAECEQVAALISARLRTLFSDCGEFYPRVFEECCRAMDRDIRMQKDSEARILEKKNAELSAQCEERTRENRVGLTRCMDQKEKLIQAVEGSVEGRLADAERLLAHEFLCLNAVDLEKEDIARGRYQRAIVQMRRILQTAEENFSNVENKFGVADGNGSRGAATSQIRS